MTRGGSAHIALRSVHVALLTCTIDPRWNLGPADLCSPDHNPTLVEFVNLFLCPSPLSCNEQFHRMKKQHMKRQSVIQDLIFFVSIWAGLVSLPWSGMPKAHAGKPNIVYIVADDLGWGDVGWHGSEIPTPNLDKLANAGAKLEAFYVQPVCSPTRAALMTGRYPIRHGLQVGVVRPWAQYGLPLEEQTLPEGLKTAGYATAIVGKWHLGHFAADYLPTRRGFDHQYGHYNGAIDYNTHIRDGGFDWHRDDRLCNDEGYSTHLLAKEAVSIVERYAGKKPFFLYVPFNAVHSPHQVPQEYLAPFQHLEGQRKLYAGMLTAMDEAVGKIVAAIDASGQRDNTLFLFNSDNGGPNPGKVTSNGKLRAGKGTHYEGGVRVAAFATWKGRIPEGSTVSEPLHIADWYPTLLQLTGANVDQRLPLDGRDVWDSLAHGKPIPDRELLINATPSAGALRQGNWKLVVTGPPAREEQEDEEAPAAKGKTQIQLFDLAADPYEEKNLAAENRDVADRMLARWREYQKEAVPIKIRPKSKTFVTPKVWGDHLTSTSSDPAALQAAAPFFAALDDSGRYWKSNEHVGKKTIVVYFYPADMTGGCTKQACSYRDAAAELSKLNVEVIGVSGDSVENHQAFKELHGLNFTLLADTDGKIAESFGVPVTRESKKVVAKVDDKELTLLRDITTKRWTFVIDTAGRIIYRNTEVTAVEDCRNVIEAIGDMKTK